MKPIAWIAVLLMGWGLLACAAPVEAAKPTPIDTVVLAEAEHPTGKKTLPVVSIPVNYTSSRVKLDKKKWPNPARSIAYTIEYSMDGGVTWGQVPGCAGISPGGGIDPETKLPREFSSIGCSVPQPTNPNRQLRSSIDVLGGPVTTTVRVGLE